MDEPHVDRPSPHQPGPGRGSRRHPTPKQLRAIAERAGGVNRLEVLLRFHKYLGFRRARGCDPSDN